MQKWAFALLFVLLIGIGCSGSEVVMVTPVTITPNPFTSVTPEPILVPTLTTASAITSLEQEIANLSGVVRVDTFYFRDVVVALELTVQAGYNHIEFAEALFRIAQKYASIQEFSVIMSDEISVPVDYLWFNNAWNITPLTQTATLISATLTASR